MKKILFLYTLTFCLNAVGQNNRQLIAVYLEKNKDRFGLNPQDISDWVIESEVTGSGSGITSCFIVQRHSGIEIFNAQSNILIKDGAVVRSDNKFKNNLADKVNTTSASLTVIEAMNKAYQSLNISSGNQLFSIVSSEDYAYKIKSGTDEDLINAKLVYQPMPDQKLRLAWTIQCYSPEKRHLWDLRIDATNGSLLEKNDLAVGCNFSKPDLKEYVLPDFKFSEMYNYHNTAPLVAVAGTYKAIPYNYESPNHHPFELITTAGNVLASPNGWHDTNMLGHSNPTLQYTFTRGNNVFAKGDASTDSPGSSVDGGTTLHFDFPYAGPTVEPPEYAAAAKTNLFYMINVLHDVWYQYGFDEASGNFQQYNYARGGLGNDYVIGVAQYGYSPIAETLDDINNAYFVTPNEGSNPRMEMLLWNRGAPPRDFFRINAPSSIAGTRIAHTNSFLGTDRIIPAIAPNGLTADLVLYNNNPTPPGYHSGCQTPTNAAELAGKIVLIKRGSCPFNLKVKNAQDAGALAVVIMDSIPSNTSTLVNMLSNQVIGITIPAVSISKEIGDELLTELNNGPVNITLEYPANIYRYADSDFDNLVISHEYGHGISTRLIGGPANSSCIINAEQMGEGWSDWFGLMMQIKPEDDGTEAKGIATYDINEPVTGPGIRTFPYSTDFAINPLTLSDSNFTESHKRGEVWAATLWDLTWAYIDKYGYDPDIYNGTAGNNKVMRLVLDALKLQTCNTASFISSRDNLLFTDQATTGGQDYCMIAEVFRRRGMGLNASSGDVNIATDQVEDFTPIPPDPDCTLSVDYFSKEDMVRVFPNPTNGMLNIRINHFSGNVSIEVVDINGRTVFSQIDGYFNIEKSVNLSSLQKGIYILKLSNSGINYTEKIIIK